VPRTRATAWRSPTRSPTSYVVYGTALSYEIDLNAVLAEVHASNMTKDAPLEPGGKAVKGPGYRPPDIAGILGGTPRSRR
jgi:hypothetical protein